MKRKPLGEVLRDSLANLNARTHVDMIGDVYMPSDSNEIRVSDGIHPFSGLISIPAQALQQAAKIAILGATANMSPLTVTPAAPSASAAVLSTGNAYTDASVITAINGAVDALKGKLVTSLGLKADNAAADTLRTQAETRLDAIEAKMDALLGAMTTANLMSAT